MKELEFLHYRPGFSVWHRHDPRLKLAELAAWSILALAGSPWTLAAVGVILVAFHAAAGTPLRRMRRPLLFWTAMAAAIVTASGFAEPAPPLTVGNLALPVGKAGLVTGALRAGRLLAVLLAGQLLASATDPAELAGAVRKITAFLPKRWSGALASALTLTLSFLPLILDEAATVRDAAVSRGLRNRRSIFRRASALALPMAEAALRRADLTTDALLSRCITDDPTEPDLFLRPSDALIFAMATAPPFAAALLTVQPSV